MFGGFGGFWQGGRGVAGHLDAEGFGEGAEDAGGAGDFGEEGDAFGGSEEVLELARVAAKIVVVDVADEPGSAGGEAGVGSGSGGAWRALALPGQGAVAPVGDEFFEALDGAVEVEVDAREEGVAVGFFARDDADDGQEAFEDGSEGGGEIGHMSFI